MRAARDAAEYEICRVLGHAWRGVSQFEFRTVCDYCRVVGNARDLSAWWRVVEEARARDVRGALRRTPSRQKTANSE